MAGGGVGLLARWTPDSQGNGGHSVIRREDAADYRPIAATPTS